MADQNLTRQWLTQLGRLTVARLTAAEAADWLAVCAPAISYRFGNECFTPRSLEHVAACCTHGIPGYGELVEMLTTWRKTFVTNAPRIVHEPFATHDWAVEERRASWRNMTPADVRLSAQRLDRHPMRIDCGRALAAALAANAPHLRDLLPPEFLIDQPRQAAEIVPIHPNAAEQRFEATHGRKPGELTPSQIAAMRAATKAPAA